LFARYPVACRANLKFDPAPSSQTAPVAQALLPVRRYLPQTQNNSST